jgi:hypothetical protein
VEAPSFIRAPDFYVHEKSAGQARGFACSGPVGPLSVLPGSVRFVSLPLEIKMKAGFLSLLFSLTLLTTQSAWSHDSVLPAGTLVQCTLDEPNFSSATAAVGDPLLCHPHGLQVFGQTVFPRGTYIVGHLADDKDPGHFWGKGFLKIEFDRMGLPGGDLPLSAKIIAVNGYKVDRDGKIIGKGHARRDIVEWLFPPLWPWKILTLPARGPRPALKGETRVTLRLMDDVIVPESAQWQRFGPGDGSYQRPALLLRPRQLPAPSAVSAAQLRTALYRPQMSSSPSRSSDDSVTTSDSHSGWRSFRKAGSTVISAPVTTASSNPATSNTAAPALTPKASTPEDDSADAQPAASDNTVPAVTTGDTASLAKTLPAENPPESNAVTPPAAKPKLTLLAVRAGTVYAVTDYWRDEDQLVYVLANGKQGQLDMDDLDWKTTSQLNNERNVKVTLREGR